MIKISQLEKCKQLVAYLKRSGLTAELSQKVQQEMEVRWNTVVDHLTSVRRGWDEVS